jgi:BirA family biotin operon repressor/biotin-[acetyl-CoA-carboxylase] ligase
MKVIKLDAIDSTNEFLKGLSSKKDLENFTIVSTDCQTQGKGQMGAFWASEVGKNLMMSILVKGFIVNISQIFDLNIVISVSVIEVLESLNIPNLSIKWPNDIMSYNKKIGGILIENSIKSDGSINSVVGLGLNVNQTNFNNLPRASSLKVICDTNFDRDQLLASIGNTIEKNILLSQSTPFICNSKYRNYLFKIDVPMPFSNQNNIKFMGIIQGVSSIGKLQILLEDDSIVEFDIKEVQMLY